MRYSLVIKQMNQNFCRTHNANNMLYLLTYKSYNIYLKHYFSSIANYSNIVFI